MNNDLVSRLDSCVEELPIPVLERGLQDCADLRELRKDLVRVARAFRARRVPAEVAHARIGTGFGTDLRVLQRT